MIPILKNEDTVLGFLKDALSCVITEERNGIFELSITYPVSGFLFDDIEVNKIILAKPNDTADNQLFRIYEVTKPISQIITVKAEHISYALANYPVSNISIKSSNATTVISTLLSSAKDNTKFSVRASDITSTADFNIVTGSVRSALGGVDGSVLDTFGGEFEFDNYEVCLHKSRGKNTGVIIAYTKNLTDVRLTISTESSYTAIFPYCYKDEVLTTLAERIINVENSSNIATKVLLKDFTSDFSNDEEISETLLRTKANGWLADNDINSPEINLTVAFEHLWQSPEYKDFIALEKVTLCDTVKVFHKGLGINISAKVIKTVYDTLGERYESIELGSSKSNFADTIKQSQKEIEQIKNTQSSYHSQITQEYLNAIDEASKAITGCSGGYVVLNPSLNPQELLVMNQPTVDTATKLWRFNLNGLGYSSSGYNGTYKTAITMNGKINADFITTGTLTANVIRAGVLASVDYSSYFNLESGYFSTAYANITGGYISIGDSNYRTVIEDGSIHQYLSSNVEIGGLVPLGNSGGYTQGIFCTKNSNVNGVSVATENASGSLSSIADFLKSKIILYKPTDIYGTTHIYGSVFTNENAENTFASIRHYRTTKFDGTNTWTAQAGFGCGNPSSRPSCALELRNYGSDTIVARLDVFQSYGEAMIGLRGTSAGSNSKVLELGASMWWGGAMNATAYYVSSTEDVKEDIRETSEVIDLFRSSKIYNYKYINEENQETSIDEQSADTTSATLSSLKEVAQSVKDKIQNAIQSSDTYAKLQAKDSVGFVIGRETPSEVISADGKHIDIYSMASISWKAIQELITRIENIESQIKGE